MPNKTIQMLPLLEKFIHANNRNFRRLPNGRPLTSGTKRNYENLYRLLQKFSQNTGFELRFVVLRNNQALFKREKKYHKQFYIKLCAYLFDELDHYDNYVGHTIKKIRAFYKWVRLEKGLDIGEFHKEFHIWKEDIQIIALSQDQLRFLINDEIFHKNLTPVLRRAKDLFVFGCATALRAGDLLSLQKDNVETVSGVTYLKLRSQKTNTYTRIKLPDYCSVIINRNKSRGSKLFRTTTRRTFNVQIKQLIEKAGWTDECPKYRTKRGRPIIVYKDAISKSHYRFCDLVSTHSMRRSGISIMLNLGLDEHYTRKVSGHAPGSTEFYKYVKYNQEQLDKSTDLVYAKLGEMGVK